MTKRARVHNIVRKCRPNSIIRAIGGPEDDSSSMKNMEKATPKNINMYSIGQTVAMPRMILVDFFMSLPLLFGFLMNAENECGHYHYYLSLTRKAIVRTFT